MGTMSNTNYIFENKSNDNADKIQQFEDNHGQAGVPQAMDDMYKIKSRTTSYG